MPRTLLLADDSSTIQRVITLTFAEEDIQVVAVGDGAEAIARVDARPPDIVLADVTMPGKNGYDVARHIKHSPQLAHIPVLLLGGAFEPVDQGRAAETGCDGVLIKPLEPQFVVGRVKELLGVECSERRTPTPPGVETVAVSTVPMDGHPSDRADESELFADSLDDFLGQVDAAIASLPTTRRALPEASSRPVLSRVLAESKTLPELAEAFAALISAGSSTPRPPEPAAAAGEAPVSDEFVDRVATRVIERLSDKCFRETVVDLVSSTAERLVREEIERIKGSIR